MKKISKENHDKIVRVAEGVGTAYGWLGVVPAVAMVVVGAGVAFPIGCLTWTLGKGACWAFPNLKKTVIAKELGWNDSFLGRQPTETEK
jgi:hypothetical protein